MKRYIKTSNIFSSWPEELTYNVHPEGDQIIEALIEVLDKLKITSEPSARGGYGTDFFYDEDGEVIGEIDLGDEEIELLNLYDESKNRTDFKRRLTKWVKDICDLSPKKPKKSRKPNWNDEYSYDLGYKVIDAIYLALKHGIPYIGYEIDIPEKDDKSNDAVLYDKNTGEEVARFNIILEEPTLREYYQNSKDRIEFTNALRSFILDIVHH